jgi:hypothetical protein
MSHRSHALALAGAAFLSMHVGGAAAQSVYVAPGGIYIAPGAGPVYVTPPAPTNGAAAAYIGPRDGYGYGTAAYVEPSYGYDDGPAAYVAPSSGYGYGPGPYVEPRYGYGYGPAPYVAAPVAPRYGYGYGPAVPNRRYYSEPRSAYAAALPPRPRVAVPYRAGRCVARHCY